MVNFLLKNCPRKLLDVEDLDGMTPLDIALVRKHAEIIKVLLDSQENVKNYNT